MKLMPEDLAKRAEENEAIRVTPIYMLERLHSLARMQGQQLVQELQRNIAKADPLRLESFGFKVFSQGDEDGIVQEIFRRIGTSNRTFFEFGAGNGLESNCAYLLLQGWRGTWMDTNPEYVAAIRKRFEKELGSGQLAIGVHKVSPEGINELVSRWPGLLPNLDLLSIDIDGNDYYVWEALTALRPRVVVIEYNAAFPPPAKLVQKYNPDSTWDSTNYFGASLQSLAELGAAKGYALVGTNLTGANAFFVREDCPDRFCPFQGPTEAARTLYNPPRFQLIEYGFPTGHSPGVGPYEALPREVLPK